MLADGGLCQAQLLHEVAVDAGVGFQQMLKYRHTRRMCQGFGYLCQFVLRLCKQFFFGNAHNHIFILQYYDI